MRRALVWGAGGLLAVAALAGGVWLGSAQRQTAAPEARAAALLTERSFKDLQGADVTLSRWRGQVVVVNFWATWCPPCREEIPGLMDVQRRRGSQGVQIVGIAIDSAEKTREYAANIGINYPLMLGGMETIDLVRALGNKAGGLPFTVVLDRRGQVSATHLGLMTVAQVEAAVRAAGG
jgi:peroxiredoxin